MKETFARWQANFVAGLAVVLPVVISIALLLWLFGTVSNITDTLLFFLPRELTHLNKGDGPMRWYWSLLALALAVFLIVLIGRLARHYFGKKLIQWMDLILLQVPLLNRIYSMVKQINDTFASSERTGFKQVVLVEFPQPGQYSVGFLTGEHPPDAPGNSGQKLVSVLIPTTPNPTSGFLIFVDESKLTKLNMSVTDGIKFIVSLGAIAPHHAIGLHAINPSALAALSPGPRNSESVL